MTSIEFCSWCCTQNVFVRNEDKRIENIANSNASSAPSMRVFTVNKLLSGLESDNSTFLCPREGKKR
jgi:hypothetical protein